MTKAQKTTFLSSVALGTFYVLVCYFVFGAKAALPTYAFLALVPLALGAVPLLFKDEDQVTSYLMILFLPWTSAMTSIAILVILIREGALCVVLIGSPFLALGALGTLVAWIVRAITLSRKKRAAAAITMLLLPFLVAPIERTYFVSEETHTVRSVVIVDAEPAAVWARLAAFEEIKDDEFQPGFWHRLGVPRPLKATIDRAALGGHRIGHFEYGLEFHERITEFVPPRRMTFTISVDPTTLRPNSTERHGLEGGYFRFVDATYSLEPLEGGKTKIELSSRYIAKSSVNAYGSFFASMIIDDFQERVLAIVQRRFQAKPGLPIAAKP